MFPPGPGCGIEKGAVSYEIAPFFLDPIGSAVVCTVDLPRSDDCRKLVSRSFFVPLGLSSSHAGPIVLLPCFGGLTARFYGRATCGFINGFCSIYVAFPHKKEAADCLHGLRNLWDTPFRGPLD